MISPEYTSFEIEAIKGHKYLARLKNSTNNCFLESIAYMFIKDTAKNPLDVNSWEYKDFYSKINLGTIKMGSAVTISQIKYFVKINKDILDMRISILAIEKGEIYAFETDIGASNASNVITLLSVPLTSEDDPIMGKKSIYSHFLPITDVDAFLSHRSRCNTRKFWCLKCFQPSSSKIALQNHGFFCENPKSQLDHVPVEGSKFCFKGHKKKFPHPITGVCNHIFHIFLVII